MQRSGVGRSIVQSLTYLIDYWKVDCSVAGHFSVAVDAAGKQCWIVLDLGHFEYLKRHFAVAAQGTE